MRTLRGIRRNEENAGSQCGSKTGPRGLGQRGNRDTPLRAVIVEARPLLVRGVETYKRFLRRRSAWKMCRGATGYQDPGQCRDCKKSASPRSSRSEARRSQTAGNGTVLSVPLHEPWSTLTIILSQVPVLLAVAAVAQ